jgi:very-short-patch-repair endonuclease
MRTAIIPYNPRLKARAHTLRQSMTLAEVLLWKRINGRQILGYDFDRQRPVGEYIVDFYCKALRLAIEVDGQSHDFKEEKDACRQRELEALGIGVLRFWDSEIKTDMQSVLSRLENGMRDREEKLRSSDVPWGKPGEEVEEQMVPSFGGVAAGRGGSGIRGSFCRYRQDCRQTPFRQAGENTCPTL